MLSTATALISATEQAVMEDEQMAMASFITHKRHELDKKQFAEAMFMYATAIASSAVDKATKVIMTNEQFADLVNAIGELETMRNEVLSDGK